MKCFVFESINSTILHSMTGWENQTKMTFCLKIKRIRNNVVDKWLYKFTHIQVLQIDFIDKLVKAIYKVSQNGRFKLADCCDHSKILNNNYAINIMEAYVIMLINIYILQYFLHQLK